MQPSPGVLRGPAPSTAAGVPAVQRLWRVMVAPSNRGSQVGGVTDVPTMSASPSLALVALNQPKDRVLFGESSHIFYRHDADPLHVRPPNSRSRVAAFG
jgi:hypothetical protein